MAGRGVDIKLGANKLDREKALAAGGLYVIGTGLNRSVRIDNQLRGRAGRQGDIGESRLFLSLDDPLLKQYSIMEDPRVKNNSEQIIANQSVLKLVRKYQKYTEGEDAEARYMLGKYSYIQEQQRKVITSLRNSILLEEKQLELMEKHDPGYYQTLVASAGTGGVRKAERQLALYFINLRWAQYLESMEYVRDGIHLTLIGGKNPIDEYHRIAISAFEEMMQDIHNDILSAMKRYRITSEGIDMEANGLGGATTTWTYMIDDSDNQFSRIPYLLKSASNKIKGTVFTVQEIYHYFLKHNPK
jgi:preprotein translocase subunit SecA